MNNYKIGRDRNGNKIVKISPVNGERGFSVQTLGALSRTHRDGVGEWTPAEVADYVAMFGTTRQCVIMGI